MSERGPLPVTQVGPLLRWLGGLTPSEAKARLDAAREDLAARRLRNRDTDEPLGDYLLGRRASVVAHPDPREALKAADDALYRAN